MSSSIPSVARLYDYALGGKDNYVVDRALFDRLIAVYPEYRAFAVANRHFLARAVRRMARSGVRQFLDLGAGIPTSPNVHELARAVVPDASVVYVDHDPVVVAHCRALSARWAGIDVVAADLRKPEQLLADPTLTTVLDLTRPVGLLAVAVLHFVEHAESLSVLAAYRDALAPGSQLALSVHVVNPERDNQAAHREGDSIAAELSTTIVARWPHQVQELLSGWRTLPPGVLDVAHCKPRAVTGTDATAPAPLWCLSAVAALD